MDTIWNCAFGIDINCQENPNENIFFTKAISVFQQANGFYLPLAMTGKFPL